MSSNLDRYKKDLEALISKGDMLELSMSSECFPEKFEGQVQKQFGDKAKEFLGTLPSFKADYQAWYSEAKAVIKVILPDRLSDFVRHYEAPKPRKELSAETYRIDDYLQGLTATRYGERVVGPDAAIPHFKQQRAILKAARGHFESALFEIRQLVQADLFDSELDAAKSLATNNFKRPAGALAGVVLERHLAQVCENHDIVIAKKAPGISDLNNALKEANVIDVPQWRFVQHLADIRNLCDHDKKAEPTAAQVADLLAGVTKVTKTLF